MTVVQPGAHNTPVILCVDDEQDLLRDIAEELAEAGYTAIEAGNGSEALARMKDHRPDLILCDISMPGLDGFGLLEAVQAMGSDYADIPFVFLSALANPREVVKGKRLGADDYLVKPIDYDLLLATVEARLRQIERINSAHQAAVTELDPDTLCSRYSLTPTEARVAVALSKGQQPMEIAERFDITRTTVAFHIRNIFGKTNTSRQAELVALLLRSALADDN